MQEIFKKENFIDTIAGLGDANNRLRRLKPCMVGEQVVFDQWNFFDVESQGPSEEAKENGLRQSEGSEIESDEETDDRLQLDMVPQFER